MMRDCSEPISQQLFLAIRQFNEGLWFECHETLEDLWVGEDGEMRYFYQGILQVAVALHHWRNGNYKGAVSLLEGGAGYLRRVQPVCQRIDVSGLIAAADTLRDALTGLGPDRMQVLDSALIPRLRLIP
jgi:predicted metal-dependent hydrolase